MCIWLKNIIRKVFKRKLKMEPIKSVTKYLDLIKSIDIKHNVFFRGHANDAYDLKPGIYREVKNNKTLVEYEDQIFREVISKSPQEFVSKNTLESLALLQHYEAPTRVLDLTENALAALYFAVSSKRNENKRGEVIVFDIPDESVCHYNSDRVTILANLSKCDKEFTYYKGLVQIYRNKITELESKKNFKTPFGAMYPTEIFDFFNINLKKISEQFADEEKYELEKYEDNLLILKDEYESKYGTLTSSHLKDFENKFIDTLIQVLLVAVDHSISYINQQFFGKLLHNIKEDKSYFDAIIDPAHISQVFAIRPKLDNPRIVRQQGAFLIYGINEVQFPVFGDFKPIAKLDTTWVVKGLNSDRILIDKDSKRSILKELEQLGVNQSTLFPEVDKVADFVRKKYENKL